MCRRWVTVLREPAGNGRVGPFLRPLREHSRGPSGAVRTRGRIGAMLRITTVNVNGIRAALRKGMGEWMESAGSQIITLQEVRAANDIGFDVRGDCGYHVQSADAEAKGRAGVA